MHKKKIHAVRLELCAVDRAGGEDRGIIMEDGVEVPKVRPCDHVVMIMNHARGDAQKVGLAVVDHVVLRVHILRVLSIDALTHHPSVAVG